MLKLTNVRPGYRQRYNHLFKFAFLMKYLITAIFISFLLECTDFNDTPNVNCDDLYKNPDLLGFWENSTTKDTTIFPCIFIDSLYNCCATKSYYISYRSHFYFNFFCDSSYHRKQYYSICDLTDTIFCNISLYSWDIRSHSMSFMWFTINDSLFLCNGHYPHTFGIDEFECSDCNGLKYTISNDTLKLLSHNDTSIYIKTEIYGDNIFQNPPKCSQSK